MFSRKNYNLEYFCFLKGYKTPKQAELENNSTLNQLTLAITV